MSVYILHFQVVLRHSLIWLVRHISYGFGIVHYLNILSLMLDVVELDLVWSSRGILVLVCASVGKIVLKLHKLITFLILFLSFQVFLKEIVCFWYFEQPFGCEGC
eukprot:TRINITY_DN3579_c0_g1_i3.p3 TRINITY_DN3579_c0_g1~~TRINITY_DN3579_c0_g1_i3.p3  ORF type:complete len:105 (-),score=4.04 TRINITY_DN3579_c0_g1_i3:325-639(-)